MPACPHCGQPMPGMVRLAEVPGQTFLGAYHANNCVVAYRREGEDMVLYEFDSQGQQVRRLLASEPKPDHWRPALRFFGLR